MELLQDLVDMTGRFSWLRANTKDHLKYSGGVCLTYLLLQQAVTLPQVLGYICQPCVDVSDTLGHLQWQQKPVLMYWNLSEDRTKVNPHLCVHWVLKLPSHQGSSKPCSQWSPGSCTAGLAKLCHGRLMGFSNNCTDRISSNYKGSFTPLCSFYITLF